jgi:Fe-S-cluster-containing hydrogenase component 2
MGKMLVIDVDKCTGCKMCELMCSFTHNGEFNPNKARIHVTPFEEQMVWVPVVCHQCEDPWCAKICPAGAITVEKDENNKTTLVKVNEEKCVGCKMCMLACPFGNIVVSDRGCAEKCDLCGGDPECAKFCLIGAIKFVDPEEGIRDRKKGVAEKVLESYKENK